MQTTPTTAVVVTHEVASYETWKRAFDRRATSRKEAGVVFTHINREVAQPNRLSVFMAGTDAGKLAGYITSMAVMSMMLDAGVTGPPRVTQIMPVEDRTRKEALAGLIVRHAVADFAAWKRGFDHDAAARDAAGLVGHAISRSVDDPAVVILYLQAGSLDQLHAFASSSVPSSAELSFVYGGSWES